MLYFSLNWNLAILGQSSLTALFLAIVRGYEGIWEVVQLVVWFHQETMHYTGKDQGSLRHIYSILNVHFYTKTTTDIFICIWCKKKKKTWSKHKSTLFTHFHIYTFQPFIFSVNKWAKGIKRKWSEEDERNCIPVCICHKAESVPSDEPVWINRYEMPFRQCQEEQKMKVFVRSWSTIEQF